MASSARGTLRSPSSVRHSAAWRASRRQARCGPLFEILVLTPGFQIKGRIELDGGSLSTLPNVERTRGFLTSLEPTTPFGSPPDPIKADGSFTLQNVYPGEYRINVFGMPQNAFVQSVRLGQTDVSSRVTILGPVSESLEIVLSTRGGRIDGFIVDKDQKPMQ